MLGHFFADMKATSSNRDTALKKNKQKTWTKYVSNDGVLR